MIRLRPSGADEVLIKRVQDWYEPGPGVFIEPQSLFSPAMLFTGTTTGAWYDPSDITTLFQDGSGTTPVTAVEQPVGLMLDKSKGLVLGPELVTNGDFSNGTTGWVTANGGAVVNSRCECTTASNFLSTTAAILTVGKWYSAEFDYFMTAGAKLRVATKDTVGPDVATIVATSQSLVTNAVTRLKIKFQAAVGGFFILQASDATFSGWVDNISVRELPGNHAFNGSGNSANFPVLSARYNLLTKTEDFSDAVWQKNGATVSANSIIAPDGTLTADKLVEDSGTSEHFLTSASYTVPATSATVLIYAKAAGRTSFIVDFRSVDAGQGRAVFDLSAVTATVQLGSGASATITAVGDGWFRCVLAATLAANTSSAKIALVSGGTPNYTGNGTSGIYIWGADLRVANDALNQPAYQRVNTATDYDTVGFKPYLRFNGTNQWLQTNSIDFTYGDKMFVSAGVRKLSDASAASIVELSTQGETNTGAFVLFSNTAGKYTTGLRGTTATAYKDVTSYVSPITNVISDSLDISLATGAAAITTRVNGVVNAGSGSGTTGASNFGNYPLYIGARAGSSLWFNGRLYQLIVAGKQASASEISSTETYINQKTGAY